MRTRPTQMKKVARRSAAKCVLVIDDHPIVLQGFRQLLEPAGVKQILEAGTLEAGFRLYRDHRPDVVILDLAMQKNELSGLSFIHRLCQRDTRTPILVFTMHSDPKIVSRTLKVGATGYVLKDDRYDDLLKAFECVRRGKTYISSELCAEDGSIKERETTNPLRPLTMRELQTLELLAEGMPYRAIAEHLHVSCATVSTTCTQLKAKLGVYTLPELMRITIQYLPSVKPSASKEW